MTHFQRLLSLGTPAHRRPHSGQLGLLGVVRPRPIDAARTKGAWVWLPQGGDAAGVCWAPQPWLCTVYWLVREAGRGTGLGCPQSICITSPLCPRGTSSRAGQCDYAQVSRSPRVGGPAHPHPMAGTATVSRAPGPIGRAAAAAGGGAQWQGRGIAGLHPPCSRLPALHCVLVFSWSLSPLCSPRLHPR